MKVRELIEKLKNLDSDLDVLGYTEDGDLIRSGQLFRLLHIEAVSVADGELGRIDDQLPSMKIGKSASSRKHVMLEMTGQF